MERKNQKTVAIVHYNTPELTRATILSIRKHGGMNYRIVVFDNSDQRPFVPVPDGSPSGVEVIDNTHGQVLNFDELLAKYPNKMPTCNQWGSDKHMWSIQKLWELLPEGFVLMDSDILLKANIDHLWQEDQCAVGHVQKQQPGNRAGIGRLVPMLCYINVNKCQECGLSYFDTTRNWMLHSQSMSDRLNWYDTGASFLEDIHAHKGGAHGRRIDIRPLMEHYKKGSWLRTDTSHQEAWLEQHRGLWEPTPQMRGEKKVAVCAIGRNENRYAVEWVEHYQRLGVSKIFIYDNYATGETPLAETLAHFVKTGLVEIIDIHDRKELQCKAYEHCYRHHGNEYAWIGFFDFDEFLRYGTKKNIEQMLAKYTEGDCLLINWRTMTDNGLTHYDDRPLKVRFTKAMNPDTCVKFDFPENDHVKCFVRGGMGEVRFFGPHCANVAYCINAKGERVPQSPFVHPYDHSVMRIDHYWTKTAEEWMHTKLARGYCCGVNYLENFLTKQEDFFFAVNERTPEKEAILRGEPVLGDSIAENDCPPTSGTASSAGSMVNNNHGKPQTRKSTKSKTK